MTSSGNLPPPRRNKLNTNIETNGEYLQIYNALRKKAPPQLADTAEHERPYYLVIDDDPDFLEGLMASWQDYYASAFTLQVLCTKDDTVNVCTFIQASITAGQRIDAIYLDRNLGTGQSSDILLGEIKRIHAIRFVPIVLMTTSPFTDEEGKSSFSRKQDTVSTHASLNLEPDWTLYNKSPEPYFLYQLASVAALGADRVRDKEWMALIQECTDLAIQQGKEAEESHLISEVEEKLERLLAVEHAYIRIIDPKTGIAARVQGLNPHREKGLHSININDIPFFKPISKFVSNTQTGCIRKENLNHADVGKIVKHIVDYHVLAALFLISGKPIGLLSLYRKSMPFRSKDEFFISQTGNVIGAFIGLKKENKQIRSNYKKTRQRELSLLRFVSTIDEFTDENTILEALANALHSRINLKSKQAKISIRMLDSPSGRLRVYLYKAPKELEVTRTIIYIDTKNSAYADSVKERKSILCNDNRKPNTKYVKTIEGMRSYLVVPLKSNGLVLGATNLENPNIAAYNDSDKAFAEGLADVAARAILKLRAQTFQRGLLKLTENLYVPEQKNHLLEEAYSLLYDFTGFACLLEFNQSHAARHGWLLESVYVHGKNGLEAQDDTVRKAWRSYANDVWPRTYVCRKLPDNEAFSYTDDPRDIKTDSKVIIAGTPLQARSQAILRPTDKDILVLLYRLPHALNTEQREILQSFVPFLHELIKGRDWVKATYDRVSIAERQAQIGQAYAQVRHALNNELLIIGDIISDLKYEGKITGNEAKDIKGHLEDIRLTSGRSKNLVKEPEYRSVSLVSIWNWVRQQFNDIADRSNITLQPLAVNIKLETDPIILQETVIYNLVDNSIQAIAEAKQYNGVIRIMAKILDDGVLIHLEDNGPGIQESIKQNLFELGKTTKSKGTGFGLNFARSRVKDLGGILEYDHTHQAGTRFSIKLPLSPQDTLTECREC